MMIQLDADLSRTSAKDNPGWVKVRRKSNSSIYYISPDGRQVSRREYDDLFKRYGDNIPASAIKGMTTPDAIRNMTSGFIADVSTRPAEHPERRTPPPPTQATVVDDTIGSTQPSNPVMASKGGADRFSDPSLDNNVTELFPGAPDPKSRTGVRVSGNRATAKELADGAYITLCIVTAIVALLFQMPEVAMEDMEAKNIAVPLGNLLVKSKINERFGRIIADSGDWQLFGYAMWMYGSRVATQLSMRAPSQNTTTNVGIGGFFRRMFSGNAAQQPMPPQQQGQPAPGSNGHQPSVTPASMPISRSVMSRNIPGGLNMGGGF